ncbi:hypothetical protein H0A66_06335 [Alcaligenaceae bacterium]|nr:hypothetical protein [Alcaligenaceae bacterium]
MTVLENEITEAIKPLLAPYLEKLNGHHYHAQAGLVEIKILQNNSDAQAALLRIDIDHELKQVQISNISIPGALKGQGLGKQLIKAIYIAAKPHGYEVFITDMAPDFYQRLLRRGARSFNDETVQINDDTALA